MFTSIYPSNESPGTDLLSEQAIVGCTLLNHLAKAIHSILLDIIQGYDDAQHAFFLLVGCVGGVLASYQTPDLRYSLQSMGPFAMCCSPVLKDTLPKGGIAYVRSRSSTTPSSTAPPTTPFLGAVKTEQHRTVHINVAFLSQLMPRIDYKLSFRALKGDPVGST
ncbi:hypothetical protein BSLG_001139 [Batrachochytrium salamandrivorans]|nr:hypothetical protein BSLG_001139 [Batrachochytrium salamandrivorans]